jgi:hypothetical protein
MTEDLLGCLSSVVHRGFGGIVAGRRIVRSGCRVINRSISGRVVHWGLSGIIARLGVVRGSSGGVISWGHVVTGLGGIVSRSRIVSKTNSEININSPKR